MNIAFDAYPLTVGKSSGIPNYVRNIVCDLPGIDMSNKYFAYAKRGLDSLAVDTIKVRGAESGMPSSGSLENTFWLFTKGVQLMKNDGIDIFWGTRQMLPPYLPKRVRTVLTVYDLVWHYYPKTMDEYNLFISKLIFKRSIKKADHIITISKSTATALHEMLNVPTSKITIAYPAADRYKPLDRSASSEYISQKYGVNKNYMLTVSTVEPRKNLSTLLKAFAGLESYGFQLLIAGASGWKTASIYSEYESLGLSEDIVKFLGYVPDEDMNRLYSGATLFIFSSIYEGFGIPPLEAMASGTPVVMSNSSSLPEVGGDAAIFVEPLDALNWKGAISRVLLDGVLRADMARRGVKQAGRFSWNDSAQKTLKVFEKFV